MTKRVLAFLTAYIVVVWIPASIAIADPGGYATWRVILVTSGIAAIVAIFVASFPFD